MTNNKFIQSCLQACEAWGIIPTSFAQSMAWEEQVLWLSKFLQTQVIPVVNGHTEAIKAIEHWLDNLDLQEEVDTKLDEMAESGELTDIIAQYLQLAGILAYDTISDMAAAENLVNGSTARVLGNGNVYDGDGSYYKIRTLKNSDTIDGVNIVAITNAPTLVAERIHDYDKEVTSQTQLNMQRKIRWLFKHPNDPTFNASTDYPNLQGGTYVGSGKMVIVRLKNNENAKLQEVDMSTGAILRTTDCNIGHGNSVTYNPNTGKLYIASLVNTSLQHTTDIYVYDYETFAYDSTIEVTGVGDGEGVHSVSYDLISDKFYIGTEDASNAYTLYELNVDTGVATKIELPDPTGYLGRTNTNDMLAYDGLVYIMKHDPSLILVYEVSNKKFIKVYNMAQSNMEGYILNEVENISIEYDKALKNLIIMSSGIECRRGFNNIVQLYYANTRTCVAENNRLAVEHGRTLYVDAASTAVNPDGTSSNKFKTIGEALALVYNLQDVTHIAVTAGTYPFVGAVSLNNELTISGHSKDDTIINGVMMIQSNIYFNQFTINNTLASQNYDVDVDGGRLRLSIVDLNAALTETIHIHNSTLELNGVSNVKIYSHAENNVVCYDGTPEYKVVSGKIPSMNKPVKLFDGNFSTTSDSTTYDLSATNPVLRNCSVIMLRMHANYSYQDIYLPNLTATGTRVFSFQTTNWRVSMVLGRDADGKLYLKSDSANSAQVTSSGVSAITPTGDFVAFAVQ